MRTRDFKGIILRSFVKWKSSITQNTCPISTHNSLKTCQYSLCSILTLKQLHLVIILYFIFQAEKTSVHNHETFPYFFVHSNGGNLQMLSNCSSITIMILHLSEELDQNTIFRALYTYIFRRDAF